MIWEIQALYLWDSLVSTSSASYLNVVASKNMLFNESVDSDVDSEINGFVA